MWKGGVSKNKSHVRDYFRKYYSKYPLQFSIRGSPLYRKWRDSIFERDLYTCQVCQKKGNINAHHIESFAKLIKKYKIESLKDALNCQELWNINNGISLCYKCHREIHKKNSKITLRPWGLFFLISNEDSFKIKKIIVKHGCRLSLQSHEYRDELWKKIQGNWDVEINNAHFDLDVISIKKRDVHRVTNIGNELLIFIEIQTGDYFGEDDIIRYEDDYNRIKKGDK